MHTGLKIYGWQREGGQEREKKTQRRHNQNIVHAVFTNT
jgi:hypothetical protein